MVRSGNVSWASILLILLALALFAACSSKLLTTDPEDSDKDPIAVTIEKLASEFVQAAKRSHVGSSFFIKDRDSGNALSRRLIEEFYINVKDEEKFSIYKDMAELDEEPDCEDALKAPRADVMLLLQVTNTPESPDLIVRISAEDPASGQAIEGLEVEAGIAYPDEGILEAFAEAPPGGPQKGSLETPLVPKDIDKIARLLSRTIDCRFQDEKRIPPIIIDYFKDEYGNTGRLEKGFQRTLYDLLSEQGRVVLLMSAGQEKVDELYEKYTEEKLDFSDRAKLAEGLIPVGSLLLTSKSNKVKGQRDVVYIRFEILSLLAETELNRNPAIPFLPPGETVVASDSYLNTTGKTAVAAAETKMSAYVLIPTTTTMTTTTTTAPPQLDPVIDKLIESMVEIPTGSFSMGSPEGERQRHPDEGPCPKPISIDGFYLGKFEVTQAQWRAVMEKDPPMLFNKSCASCPVNSVSWIDAQKFIRKLNTMTGLKFRLPSEAEWEYACRAGSATPFSFGECLDMEQGNYHAVNQYGECPKDGFRGRLVEVGVLEPNAWGIYDMHGNVWEWCRDIYSETSYETLASQNPVHIEQGRDRVFRGGSFINSAHFCRSAKRNFAPEDLYDYDVNSLRAIGFRLAMDK